MSEFGEQIYAWWWLPDHPEDVISGVATFQSGERGEVHVLGMNLKIFSILKGDEVPLVYGRDTKRRSWTLTNVSFKESLLVGSLNSKHPSFYKMKLGADRILLGAHVPTDRPSVREMVFYPSGLKEWAGSDRGIQFEHDQERDLWVSEIRSGKWREPIVAEIGEGRCLIIEYIHQQNYSNENYSNEKGLPVSHSCACRVTFETGETLETCFKIIKLFCDFISFATRITSGIDEYSVKIDGGGDDGWVRVWGLNSALRHGTENRVYGQDMRNFFTIEGVPESAGSTISLWYKGTRKFGTAYSLYFAVALRSARTYLEHEFLTYVQCLEGFGRKEGPTGKLMPEKDYRKIVKDKIVPFLDTLVNENVAEAIRCYLYMANNKTLGEILSELLSKRGDEFTKKWIPGTDVNEWVKEVVVLRNDFVHVLDKPEAKQTFYEDGWNTIIALRLLVEAQLLEMIGFSGEKTDEILCHTPKVERRIAT